MEDGEKDVEKERLFNSIRKYSDMIHAQMVALLPGISSSIDDIIEGKERDSHKIETILDSLLDFGQLGVGKEEFYKLNTYYGSFDADAAIVYHNFYVDMNGED